MSIKTFVLSGAAACAMVAAAPALAADLPVAPAPVEPAYVPPPEPAFTWTGGYIGLNAGYGWGDFGIGEATAEFDSFDLDSAFGRGGVVDGAGTLPGGDVDGDGFIAGGQIGYNWQVNQFVLGAEADFQYSGIESDIGGYEDVFAGNPGDFNAEVGAELEWFGTARARAGYAMGRFLPYVTGGLAYGQAEGSASIVDTVGGTALTASDDNMHLGWTAGAGVEGAVTDNITARLEYLYVDLGEENYNFAYADGAGGTSDVSADADLDAHVVRGALNYKFNF